MPSVGFCAHAGVNGNNGSGGNSGNITLRAIVDHSTLRNMPTSNIEGAGAYQTLRGTGGKVGKTSILPDIDMSHRVLASIRQMA